MQSTTFAVEFNYALLTDLGRSDSLSVRLIWPPLLIWYSLLRHSLNYCRNEYEDPIFIVLQPEIRCGSFAFSLWCDAHDWNGALTGTAG